MRFISFIAFVVSLFALILSSLGFFLHADKDRRFGQLEVQQQTLADQLADQSEHIASVEADNDQQRTDIAKLQAETRNLLQDVRASQDESEMNETATQAALRATYLVIASDGRAERAIGTAWVVTDTLLATNAHVADVFNEDLTLIVRNQSSEHVVVGMRQHAGYKAFQDTLDHYQPLSKQIGGWSTVQIIGGYDVALLEVDNVEALPEPLVIASTEKLRGLKRLQTLFMTGFPLLDTQSGAIENITLNPRASRGNVLTTAPYIPHSTGEDAQSESRSEIEYFVLHDLFAAPGNSGSPIFNTQGEVVAVLSHGFGGRNIAGEKGAQRADLVRELLDSTDVSRVRDFHRPLWDDRLRRFEQAQTIVQEIVERAVLENGVPESLSGGSVSLVHQKITEATFGKRRQEFSFTYTSTDPSGVETNETAVIPNAGYYHEVDLQLELAQFHIIYAYDYRVSGRCPVRILQQRGNLWGFSDTILRRREDRIFGMDVRVKRIESAPDVSEMKTIFFQDPRCTPSPKFSYGIVSWDVEMPGDAGEGDVIGRLGGDGVRSWISGVAKYIEDAAGGELLWNR